MYKKCKTLQSAQRQQHIIETLISLMQTNTYDEISVSTLCEHAEIPRKTFYRYFDSKEDLLQATLDSLRVNVSPICFSQKAPQCGYDRGLRTVFPLLERARIFFAGNTV